MCGRENIKTVHLYDVNKCLNIYLKCFHWLFERIIFGKQWKHHTQFFQYKCGSCNSVCNSIPSYVCVYVGNKVAFNRRELLIDPTLDSVYIHIPREHGSLGMCCVYIANYILLLNDSSETAHKNIHQDILIRSLSLCIAYCFIARLGGINELLSPTLLFFTGCSPGSSSSVRVWDPPPHEPAAWDSPCCGSGASSIPGVRQSAGVAGVWRSLSWANLHLIPNLHLLSFLYDTHTLLPPMWEGLAFIVSGTCFCKALSFWSAWALNGLANTLLSEQAFRGGGGSLLGAREAWEGGGRACRLAAGGAGVWGCEGDEEGSGSCSSGSDSLPESLEAEPDSSKKFRVFLTTVTSSPASLT